MADTKTNILSIHKAALKATYDSSPETAWSLRNQNNQAKSSVMRNTTFLIIANPCDEEGAALLEASSYAPAWEVTP